MAENAPVRRWRLVRAPGLFLPLAGGLISFAWAALLLWELSPYGRYLNHGRWTEVGLASTICAGLPAGDLLAPMLLYAGGWLLMLAAMMLPTTLPLLQRFHQMVSARTDRGVVGLLIAGYLLAWTGFGLAAHGLDLTLHLAARHAAWLPPHAWLVGAAVLLVAGAFQFTPLKYRCLDRCRTPVGFIVQHWRGARPGYEAFRLGLDHGVYCVGCCWALMLLMFVVGTGNVGWMLLLGAIMALEKNAPWGRKLSPALGGALIGWATVILVGNLV